jgi:hypothetical protein
MDILPRALTLQNIARYEADVADPGSVYKDPALRASPLTNKAPQRPARRAISLLRRTVRGWPRPLARAFVGACLEG